MSRRESARARRSIVAREHEDTDQGGIRQDGDRGTARQGNAELPDQPDGRREHGWPLRLPQGAVERRHHAGARAGAEGVRRSGVPQPRFTGDRACSLTRARIVRRSLCGAALGMVLAGSALAAGEEAPKAFRPCIDPSNLPFANSKGEGFENRIAALFAQKLGLPVENYAFPQRMNFIRNTLRYKLPGEDFRCDIVMSVPAGYDQTSTTIPYYRSTYMLVYPKGKGLDRVKTGSDLFTLGSDARAKLIIGVYDRSPGSIWLAKHGLEEQARPYPMMSPDPEMYPGEIIERDLAEGKINAAIVWGPIAG